MSRAPRPARRVTLDDPSRRYGDDRSRPGRTARGWARTAGPPVWSPRWLPRRGPIGPRTVTVSTVHQIWLRPAGASCSVPSTAAIGRRSTKRSSPAGPPVSYRTGPARKVSRTGPETACQRHFSHLDNLSVTTPRDSLLSLRSTQTARN
jgi:hypothetical protein